MFPIGEVPAYRTELEITARRKLEGWSSGNRGAVRTVPRSCLPFRDSFPYAEFCLLLISSLSLSLVLVLLVLVVFLRASMLFPTPRTLPCVSLTPRNAWPTCSHYQLCLFSGCAFCCCFSLK